MILHDLIHLDFCVAEVNFVSSLLGADVKPLSDACDQDLPSYRFPFGTAGSCGSWMWEATHCDSSKVGLPF